jgi:N-acetylornithine carbamoyltransferase
MHFLTTIDLSREQLDQLIESALRFKRGEDRSTPLAGKSVALVFFNPSLRTRASMQVGIYELGGNPVVLEPGGTSWTLDCVGIGVRTFATLKNWPEERIDPVLNAFARYASVPIINLESAMHHPCQSLADMMTIREKLGAGRKRVVLTWAWHPKPLPMAVPNSFALAAAQMGHDLVIAHPPGFELDEELIDTSRDVANASGGSLKITNDIEAAFTDAEVVYAKSWGGKQFYGNSEQDTITRAQYRRKWIVDEEKMARTDTAIFMHCLPVRRNVIVTDAVIDSPSSVVIDEAENRLHVQKAVLNLVLGK